MAESAKCQWNGMDQCLIELGSNSRHSELTAGHCALIWNWSPVIFFSLWKWNFHPPFRSTATSSGGWSGMCIFSSCITEQCNTSEGKCYLLFCVHELTDTYSVLLFWLSSLMGKSMPPCENSQFYSLELLVADEMGHFQYFNSQFPDEGANIFLLFLLCCINILHSSGKALQ